MTFYSRVYWALWHWRRMFWPVYRDLGARPALWRLGWRHLRGQA